MELVESHFNKEVVDPRKIHKRIQPKVKLTNKEKRTLAQFLICTLPT